jgi:hypothetical protein
MVSALLIPLTGYQKREGVMILCDSMFRLLLGGTDIFLVDMMVDDMMTGLIVMNRLITRPRV